MTTTLRWWMIVAAVALAAPGWTAQFFGTTMHFVAAQGTVRLCRVVVVEHRVKKKRHHMRI
jgi:hypothetical protein